MTNNLPSVIDPEAPKEKGHLGPAMRALIPKQQAWVHATIRYGCDATKAAALAGYQGDRNTLKSTGWKLAHDAKVQEALREEAAKVLRTHSVMAVGVIAEIAADKRAAPRDRLRAAAEILNRSGLYATSEHKVVVEDRSSRADQIRSIARYCDDLGLDVRVQLRPIGVTDAELIELGIIDAEFTVVTDKKEPDHG